MSSGQEALVAPADPADPQARELLEDPADPRDPAARHFQRGQAALEYRQCREDPAVRRARQDQQARAVCIAAPACTAQ